MSEISAKVRLWNAMDEALVRRGMLPPDQVRTCEVEAAVDTESVRCVIPAAVAERLGVTIRGRHFVELADGHRTTVPVAGAIYVEISGRDTVEDALIHGDEVRIGYTVLAKLDFVADRANRLIPNPAHPEQPVTRV